MRALEIEPLDFAINAKNLAEGVTQSEMQTLDDCAEKWYLQYNLLLKKRGTFSWALQYGTWIHSALEEWYTSGCTNYTWNPELDSEIEKSLPISVRADKEYWQAIGRVQMEVYVSRYKQDRKVILPLQNGVEKIIDLEFDGFRLKGMIDVLVRHMLRGGKKYIMDHKTCSRLDPQTTMGWNFRFQFMFYCWLAWKQWPKRKIRGTIINAIRKPGLVYNPAKESLEGHAQRVAQDMRKKPESYFYREVLSLTRGKLLAFEQNMLRPKLHRITLARNPKVDDSIKIAVLRNKNTNHCNAYGAPCQFLPACQNGLKLEGFQYHTRETKHEELIPE